MDEGIEMPGLFGRNVGVDGEVLDLAGDLGGKGIGIEARDAAMPLRPAIRLAHPVAMSLPTGLTRPSPVTTTRRRLIRAAPENQALGWALT